MIRQFDDIQDGPGDQDLILAFIALTRSDDKTVPLKTVTLSLRQIQKIEVKILCLSFKPGTNYSFTAKILSQNFTDRWIIVRAYDSHSRLGSSEITDVRPE